jgi:hypothetical protein
MADLWDIDGIMLHQGRGVDTKRAAEDAVRKGTSLRRADLRGKDLTGAILYRADLREANLQGAKMARANLAAASMQDADLTDAWLEEADFRDANLRRTIFRRANLRRADMRWAILEGAELEDTDLESVVLYQANLRGVDLRPAYLQPIRDDFFAILNNVREEIPFLRAALIAGRIDGGAYNDKYSGLVGTLAMAQRKRGGEYHELVPRTQPAKRFCDALNSGDTPTNSSVAAVVLDWLDEYAISIGA